MYLFFNSNGSNDEKFLVIIELNKKKEEKLVKSVNFFENYWKSSFFPVHFQVIPSLWTDSKVPPIKDPSISLFESTHRINTHPKIFDSNGSLPFPLKLSQRPLSLSRHRIKCTFYQIRRKTVLITLQETIRKRV